MLITEDKSQRQRHVYISSRTYARRSRTPQLQEIVLSARDTSVSPPQVVSELVNSPRAVGCGFSHFSTACRRFYCSSGRHFASSRRKSTPSRYFVYGPRPVSAARDLLCIWEWAGLVDRETADNWTEISKIVECSIFAKLDHAVQMCFSLFLSKFNTTICTVQTSWLQIH